MPHYIKPDYFVKKNGIASSKHLNLDKLIRQKSSGGSGGGVQPGENLSVFTDDIGATDGIVPLAAFIDTTSGDDNTATLENFNKPFSTIEGVVNALPPTTGETYNIYINGSTLNVTRKIPSRNFNFISNGGTTIDFTNCLEDDGVTHATYVIENIGSCIWTFEDENISINSSYVGQKVFSYTNNNQIVNIKGVIDQLTWSSANSGSRGSFRVGKDSSFRINKLYDTPQTTVILGGTNQGRNDIYIRELFVEHGNNIANELTHNIIIDKISQIGVQSINMTINQSSGSGSPKVTLGDIDIDGTLKAGNFEVNFNGSVSDTTLINLNGQTIVSGRIESNNFITSTYFSGDVRFDNFNGKLNAIRLYNNNTVTFVDCNIEVDTHLFSSNNSGTATADPKVKFIGYNTVNTNNPQIDLMGGYQWNTGDFESGTLTIIPYPFDVTINGALVTNAKTYGRLINVSYNGATFKEKLGEVVIRNKKDLVNKTLDTSLTYIIDGEIILLTGEYIEVPAGGNLTINGYGLEASKITKNVTGESIFSSPVGGSGGLQMQGLKLDAGLGSVFNLTAETGNEALEFNVINIENSASIGTLDGFRQFLGTTLGIYGCSDGFTLAGTWNGFKITNTNSFGFGASGTLFKAGTGLSFSSRFFAELNISFPTGALLSDFSSTNFVSDNLFQLKDGQYTLNSSSDATTNTPLLLPNIDKSNSKCLWEQNVGLLPSTVLAKSEIAGEIAGSIGGLNIVKISQADYDAGIANSNTFYAII